MVFELNFSTLLSFLGSLPAIIYIVYYIYTRPKIRIFFNDESLEENCAFNQAGNNIILIENKRRHNYQIEKVSIVADFDCLEIDKSPQCISEIVYDADPIKNIKTGIIFNTSRELKPKTRTGYFLQYVPKAKGKHTINISVTLRIEESELPFLLDMFPARAFRINQSLQINCL